MLHPSTRLDDCARQAQADMRKHLTIYARRDDIVDVLQETRDDRSRACNYGRATMDAEGPAPVKRAEIQLHYYIETGSISFSWPMSAD